MSDNTNNQTVPDDVIEDAVAAGFYKTNTNGIGFAGFDIEEMIMKLLQLQRQREAVAQHEVEAVGEIVTTVMGDNEVCMIQWKGKYKPKKGDHIYAAPPLPTRELLEQAADLAVLEDPRTGDWMYDDRELLAQAIRNLIPTEKEPS